VDVYLSYGRDVRWLDLAEIGSELPDLVHHIARRQMPIVLLDHFRIFVAEVPGHHVQRHTGHHRKARPGMPKSVESDPWLYARPLDR
jgi:hypothetical protein